MKNNVNTAINKFVEWRTPYYDVDDPIQEVAVEKVGYAGLQPFECATNAQKLNQALNKNTPSNFEIVSGWIVNKDPIEYAENKFGYYFASHYWNYMKSDGIYIDATPVAPHVPDREHIYIKDSTVWAFARNLDRLGIEDVSVVAPTFIIDEDGEFIECEEIGDGAITMSDRVFLEGSLGNIFHRHAFVNGEWHPALKEWMEAE